MPKFSIDGVRRFACLRTAAPIALLPLFLLAGCGGSGGGKPDPNPPTGTGDLIQQPGWSVRSQTRALSPKKWTFLVYMNAANDLERFGSLNMNQMEQSGSTGDVNIVLQYKRISQSAIDDDTSNGNWTDTRRYYVTRDSDTNNTNSPIISQSSNIDMGRAQTLQEFVQWGVKAYPAEKYCLVIWNHGAGWRSRSRSTSPITRGVSYDDDTGSHIDTIELADAVSIGRKWDIISFDSSLMQMVEVAYEIRDQATYIVGSEESPPGTGYRYERLMGSLTGNPTQTPLTFATFIAQDTLAAYGTGSEITQSVLDASKVGSLAPTLNTLGAALTSAQGAWGTQIATARRQSETYGDSGRIDYTQNKDLIDFLNKLGSVGDPGVISAVQGVRSSLSATILSNANGSQHPRSNGLSIYIPSPLQYAATEEQQNDGFGQPYSALSFSRAAPAWRSFLQTGPP